MTSSPLPNLRLKALTVPLSSQSATSPSRSSSHPSAAILGVTHFVNGCLGHSYGTHHGPDRIPMQSRASRPISKGRIGPQFVDLLFQLVRVVDFFMDGALSQKISGEATSKPRPFDPAKTAVSHKTRLLVAELLERIERAERRQRRRRKLDQERHEATVEALVCDLIHRALGDPQAWVMVEMRKDALSPRKRRAPFLTEAFPSLVKTLCSVEVGAAQLQLGHYASWFGGERTTIRVTPWLDSRIDELDIHYEDIGRNLGLMGEPLVLRGRKAGRTAETLPLPDTVEVHTLRNEMDLINGWLAHADISYVGDEEVDLGQRYLRRIFNNGSLKEGGRLYHGFWQDLSKDDRMESLRIEGAPVVSLDFAQMSVRTTYAMAGIEPPDGDLYELPDVQGSREGVKMVLNALLASDRLPTRFPRGSRPHFAKREKIHSVLAGIRKRHPALIPFFGKAQALALMNLESQVIVAALLQLKDRGVVALPVHDCILVGEHRLAIAQKTLEQASSDVLGQYLRVEVEGTPPRGLPQPTEVILSRSPIVGGVSP